MPELETLDTVWTLIDRLRAIPTASRASSAGIVLGLELALVELKTIVEQELVGGLHAGLDAVLDNGAGSWWTGQLLNLPITHIYEMLIPFYSHTYLLVSFFLKLATRRQTTWTCRPSDDVPMLAGWTNIRLGQHDRHSM